MRHNLTAYVCDGCFNAVFYSIGYLAQSRIDAAVLAERETCAKLAEEMPDTVFWERPGGRPTGSPVSKYHIAQAIRARTTTPEIAGGQPTPSKEDAPASAAAAGESPAPLRKVVQLVVKPYGSGRHALIGLYDNGDIEEIGWNDL